MEEYISCIKYFAINWEPIYYILCDGRLLQISHYQALFALLGCRYGGDGLTTFGIPDLRPYESSYEIVEEDGKQTIKVTKTKRNWNDDELRPMMCVNGIFPSRQ
jgi:microcystin-dependent protein